MYSKLESLCPEFKPTCTKAVCGAALEVKMEEKPGVMPMFETMILSSSLGTSLRTMSSTWAMSWSLSSRRVPEGALTLMTNWLGSVRGKNALPMNG